jgi:hypothetical protein
MKNARPLAKKYLEQFMKPLYPMLRLELKQRSDVASKETNAAQKRGEQCPDYR